MFRIFCDRCEKDFSEVYPGLMQSQNPGLFKIQELGPNNQYFDRDLCPECSKEIAEWLRKGKDNNEKV